MASAAEIAGDVIELIRPPRKTTVAESAARNLKIVNPSGVSGNWRADEAPYMVQPMNLARSRLFEAVVFMGPARAGKTQALIDGVLAYTIVDDPAHCMIVQTSQGQAADFSKTRIGPSIDGSPELAKRLSPRANDNNIELKMFRSGMSLRFGYPSLGQLSGKDIRRMLMTDVDNFTGDMDLDEAFKLALKRTQTYMSSGICIVESNPTRDYADPQWRPSHPHEAPPADGIASLYNRGDRRLLYWPCLECKEPFAALPGVGLFALPEFEELKDRLICEDPLAMADRYARVCCPHCGAQIEAKWKDGMVASADWVAQGQRMWPDRSITGEAKRSRIASFWLGGVAAGWQSWSSLLESYFQALKQYATTGETKPLKSTVNVDQAMPFLPPALHGKRKAGHELQKRAEDQPQGKVPHGVRFLTAQVDVQAGKRAGFVVKVQGWGPHREHWTIDRFHLRHSERIGEDGKPLLLDPAAYVEDWRRLVEKAITRRYPLADGSGRTMPVRVTLCDMGGRGEKGGEISVTSRAYDFWRQMRAEGLGSKFVLVKGSNSSNAPRTEVRYPDSRGRKESKSGAAGDVPVLFINTDQIKDTIASDLKREDPGPGFWHFPDWMPTSAYDELTAETRTAKGWANASGRHNEELDLCVYGEAAWHALQADKINWDSPPPWARDWDQNPDVRRDDEEEPPPARVLRRGNRTSGVQL